MANLKTLRAKLIKTARPSVLMMRQPPGADPVSRSAFGGLPRLPADLDWPVRAATGKPMSFVAQIDLAELPPVARTAGLPARGVLWIFADHDAVGLETDAVCVLFRQDADGAEPERPAPPDLGPLKRGTVYAWLSPGDPATRIDIRRAIRFLAVAGYDGSFDEVDYDRDDDETYDALNELFGELRDAALRQVLPEGPALGLDWYALLSTWNSEAWPSAGIFAELAVGATLDAVPPVRAYLDGRVKWTSEGMAIRAALEAEARSEQARWAARRYEVLSADDRKALRGWVEAFVARAAILRPDMTDGQRSPDLSDVQRKIAASPSMAVNMIQAHGGPAMANLPWRPTGRLARSSDHDQMLGYGRAPYDMPDWNRDHVLLLQMTADASTPWRDQAVMRLWLTHADLVARRFDRVIADLATY